MLPKGVEDRGALAPVGKGGAAARDDLASLTLLVVAAEASPLTEGGLGLNLHEGNTTVLAEGGDELGVLLVVAVSGQEAEDSSAAVNGLDALADATKEAVLETGGLHDVLKSLEGIGLNDILRGNGVLNNRGDVLSFHGFLESLTSWEWFKPSPNCK